MAHRRLSPKRTLIGSLQRAIKLQLDWSLPVDKCDFKRAKNRGESTLLYRFA
jgi:hypothetical protein